MDDMCSSIQVDILKPRARLSTQRTYEHMCVSHSLYSKAHDKRMPSPTQ